MAEPVGLPLRRREDVRVLLGRTRYLDDLAPAGLAHVAFVRSPYAHARLQVVESSSPGEGVLAVLTAQQLGLRPFPVSAPPGVEIDESGAHPILADTEVGYVGQPVAAVVATSRAAAVDGCERVQIAYEPLEAVVDPHRSERELLRWSRSAGDVEGAFAGAATVVRGRYGLPRLAAVPIEPRGALAEPEGELLTVWCSAQDPHRPRAQLAHILRRPPEQVRVVVPDVGGAFGSKGVIAAEVAVVAAAAQRLGRPVKWVEDRSENLLGAYQGRGMQGELELALDGSGRMLGLRAQLLADLGAYLFTTTAIPPHTAAMLMTGCYQIPAASVEVRGVATHKVPTGPYRGAGRPEAAYLLERLVDDAARQLGVDAVELRRRNLIRHFPHRTALGFEYDSGDYERCLDTAVSLCGEVAAGRPGRRPGRAVALFVERAGGQWEQAAVSVGRDGEVVVRSSACPHGQGHETTFAQIAAAGLGVDLSRVHLRFGDSGDGPAGVGTFGSRSVAVAGSAIVVAVERLIDRGRAVVTDTLGVADVVYGGGWFSGGGARLALGEVAGLEAAGELRAEARFDSALVFSSGAYAAVVEIDEETGRLEVLRVVAVDDAGTIVNPRLAHGQVVGGAVQGLGECLTEAVVHRADGQPVTGTLVDYQLLSAAEVPPILCGTVVSPTPHNPLGAKGVGEGGAIGTLAAVAGAVGEALGGRHVDPPFTPEKLWRALREDRAPA